MTAPPRLVVRVPGSTSNLGPGFDCLGMAVDRWLEIEWSLSDAPVTVERHGTLRDLNVDPRDDLVLKVLAKKTEVRGHLRVGSSIPLSRGLGSSAAARVAALLLGHARQHLVGAPDLNAFVVPRDEILDEAAAAEGHSDNVAPALWGGLVAVGGPAEARRVVPLVTSPRIGWCYAAPGVEVRTDEARAALPSVLPHAQVGANGARLAALQLGLATAQPEMIAWGMHDEVHTPWRLPLIPGGADAMRAALEAGAWGVAISGSGSGLIAAGARESMAPVVEAMGRAFAGHGDAAQAFAFECRTAPEAAQIRLVA